jgi:hypothetical protein
LPWHAEEALHRPAAVAHLPTLPRVVHQVRTRLLAELLSLNLLDIQSQVCLDHAPLDHAWRIAFIQHWAFSFRSLHPAVQHLAWTNQMAISSYLFQM